MTTTVTDATSEDAGGSRGQKKESHEAGLFKTPDGRTVEIRDVWANNLEEEMEVIRELILKYNYVAMVCDSYIMSFNFFYCY